MKKKTLASAVLALILLPCLFGCAPAEEIDSIGVPGMVAEGEGYRITDLVIQEDSREQMVFYWNGSQENDTQYIYRINRDSLQDSFYRDAQGNPADPALFTPGVEVTLCLKEAPANPGYGYKEDVETSWYIISQENILQICLTEGDNREVLFPFENLSSDELTEIQIQMDRMDPPAFAPMSQAGLTQAVSYLRSLPVTIQTQPGAEQIPESTPCVMGLRERDGSETTLDFTGGENYQLAVTSGDSITYYAIRYQAYQPVLELILGQRVLALDA